jgi:hypothetical protein
VSTLRALLFASIVGSIAAAIGAALWVGMVLIFKVEWVWITLILGVLTGVGVRVGAGDRHGFGWGLLAALLAAVAILGSRAIVFSARVDSALAAERLSVESTDAPFSPDRAVMMLAKQLDDAAVSKGDASRWPSGLDPTEDDLAECPGPLRDEAQKRFSAMTPDDQGSYIEAVTRFVTGRRQAEKAESYNALNSHRQELTFAAVGMSFWRLSGLFALAAVCIAFWTSFTSSDEKSPRHPSTPRPAPP